MNSLYEVNILIADKELTRSVFDSLLPLVSRDKRDRITKFHSYRDAQNALLGDIAARMLICRATGLSNSHLEFTSNEYGKPFLINDPHVHHNISHANQYIACVLDDQPVGIDIEHIKPIEMKIAKRFFAPDEIAYVVSADDSLLVQRFYEIWTKKESRIKWEGKGLSTSLPAFSVFDPLDTERIYYHEVFRNDDYICHVCTIKPEKPPVKVIDIDTFLSCII